MNYQAAQRQPGESALAAGGGGTRPTPNPSFEMGRHPPPPPTLKVDLLSLPIELMSPGTLFPEDKLGRWQFIHRKYGAEKHCSITIYVVEKIKTNKCG